MKERLQKILARAGHGSRRSAEALIASGRVRVNGEVSATPGVLADAAADRIEVDGRAIELPVGHVYLAMNKPAGHVTTLSDPQRRPTVMDLLPRGLPPHVFPVGRLDLDTEGLLMFTDDGEFAHRLAHPRYEIEKEYLALVAGSPDAAALTALHDGVEIEGGRTRPARAEIAAAPAGYAERDGHAWLRLVIHEGRKRQVRLMCAAVGHPVAELVRSRIDALVLGPVRKGDTRSLTDAEIGALRAKLGLDVTP